MDLVCFVAIVQHVLAECFKDMTHQATEDV